MPQIIQTEIQAFNKVDGLLPELVGSVTLRLGYTDGVNVKLETGVSRENQDRHGRVPLLDGFVAGLANLELPSGRSGMTKRSNEENRYEG